ncbi:MAG: 6-phosphogluconolactonase [bacterium]|nr:6-phosphogluconolactonase [bacterium]
MKTKNFSTEQAWIDSTISFIKSLKPHSIALSGGSTPVPIYQALGDNLPKETQFYQVDERYVPSDNPNSNYGMIKKNIFPHTNNLQNFHYFDTALPIDKALKKYTNELTNLKGFPSTTFDLCILGIGLDGHTASLFPVSSGAQNVQPVKSTTPEHYVEHTINKEFAIKDRLTITFPTILKSKNILVLLKNKPTIIQELQKPSKTTKQFPALTLLNHPNLSIHSFDENR